MIHIIALELNSYDFVNILYYSMYKINYDTFYIKYFPRFKMIVQISNFIWYKKVFKHFKDSSYE